jgi:NAD(P)-dependent dehydrogenase (short-subunit alcohol dehydrogenase family)
MKNSDFNFVLVTGSTRGIGFEIVRQLLSRKMHVIISGRIQKNLDEAEKKLAGTEGKVYALLMDVSSEESVRAAAKKLASDKVTLNVIVNNAAILLKDDHSLLKNENAILEKTLNTNSEGPLRVTRAFLPLLTQPSRIINMSSGGGSMTDAVGGWSPAYCVSKTLLNSITRQLAYELSSGKISVNAVCPGWVKTDMGGSTAPRTVQKGAETPVWLALDAPQNLSGKFFRDKEEIDW